MSYRSFLCDIFPRATVSARVQYGYEVALPSRLISNNTILISVAENLFSYLSNLLVGGFEQVSPWGLGRFRALLSSALEGRSEELSTGEESAGLRKVSDGLRK